MGAERNRGFDPHRWLQFREKVMKTVGELKKEVLDYCDDSESLYFFLDYIDFKGNKKTMDIDFVKASSSGGGSVTLLTFKPKE